ncbi:MAG: OmpA family protein [bacterium]|nr:OmpA family protein [bacterium]
MDQDRRAGKILITLGIWIAIVGIGALAWVYVIQPRMSNQLVAATSSDSAYAHTLACAADGFSGYAFLRSPAMTKTLKDAGIKLDIRDDKADYAGRMQAMAKGDVDLAVFTIDSFIKAGVKLGYTRYEDFPGTIVLVVDQTVGGDAMVAYEEAVPTMEALNHPEGRFMFTPDSPSEFLGRVAYATFSYPLVPEQWYEEADGAADVLKKLKAADPKAKRIYVLWEPYLSEALKIKGVKKLLGSDKCTDCIVDVLVFGRAFAAEHPELVEQVTRAYLSAAHSYQQTQDTLHALLIADAEAGGEKLSAYAAAAIADGIQWKRVRENYIHFGLEEDPQGKIKPLEDLVVYVVGMLEKTGAFPKGTLTGSPTALYFSGTMRALQASNYHPGKKAEIIADLGPGAADLEAARAAADLPALDDAGWAKLAHVGSARVEPISFKRGTAEISEYSQADLDALAGNVSRWSTYYVRIVGSSQAVGDAKANAALAAARATAVRDALVAAGIAETRVRTASVAPSADGRSEVRFEFLQQQY